MAHHRNDPGALGATLAVDQRGKAAGADRGKNGRNMAVRQGTGDLEGAGKTAGNNRSALEKAGNPVDHVRRKPGKVRKGDYID